MPSGLQIFARAIGVTEKEFLKMMERGELMADEVLPKVSKEMARMAREGGALDIKMQSNRASMNRMITSFQDLQNTFFKGGFGAATQKLFDGLRNTMEAMIPVANQLGYAINVAFTTASFPIRLVAATLSDLFQLLGVTGESTFAKMIGWLAGLTAGFYALRVAAGFARVAVLALWKPVAALAAGLVATFGAIPVAIAAAVGTGLALIIAYWDDIKAALKAGWEWVTNLFGIENIDVNVARNGALSRSPASVSSGGASATPNTNLNVNVSVDDDGKVKAYVQDATNRSMGGLQSDIQAANAY